jgi:frataxin-like iron-binding protein CyaY
MYHPDEIFLNSFIFPGVWLFSHLTLYVHGLCSGPSRFDWDATGSTWVYRRTKSNLKQLLEEELQKLCGEPIDLS